MNDFMTVSKDEKQGVNILVSEALFAASDAEINAALPDDVPVGALIHTKGYAGLKEKGLDGSWTSML